MGGLDPDQISERCLRCASAGEVCSEVHHGAMFAHSKILGKEKVCTQQLVLRPAKWHHQSMKLNLKALRKERNLTISQLAEMAGLSNGFVSQLENSKRKPGADTLEVLATALKVKITDLIDAGEDSAAFAEVAVAMAAMSPEDRARMVLMSQALVPKPAD